MTTEQHPITPSEDVIEALRSQAPQCDVDAGVNKERETQLVIAAYRAGADQELEACREWASQFNYDDYRYQDELRDVRRPKPPSLAENVSKALDRLPGPGADASYLRIWADKEAYGLRCAVRRALERLQELEEGNE